MMADLGQIFNVEKIQKIINNPLTYRQEFLVLLFLAITLVLLIVVFFSLLVLRSPRLKVKWETVPQQSRRLPVLIIGVLLVIMTLALIFPVSRYLASDRLCLSCHRFDSLNSFSHQKQGCRSCHIRFGFLGVAANNVAVGAKLLNKYAFSVGKVDIPIYETNCWQCHQKVMQQVLVKQGRSIRHKTLLKYSCLSCHKDVGHTN